MNKEKTNQLFSDTNVLVPRVLLRGSLSVSSFSAISGSKYRGTGSVTFDEILSLNNPCIDCFYYSSGGGSNVLIKMNRISDTTGTIGSAYIYYLDSTTSNGNDVARLNIDIVKTDTGPVTVYYILYSLKITNDIIL